MSIGRMGRTLLLSWTSVNEIDRYNSIALHWTTAVPKSSGIVNRQWWSSD